MLACQKCGYSNELGRIFCHQCGTKLDLSLIKAPGQGGPKLKKKSSRGWKSIRMFVELVILLVIIAGIVLAWQVPAAPATNPSDREKAAAETKHTQLEMLSTRNRPGKLTVSAAELNAYLASLQMEKAPEGTVVLLPGQIRFELGDGTVKVRVWGVMRVGSSFQKQFYFSYTCEPALQDGALQFRPLAGRVGQLPINKFVLEHVPFLENYVRSLFGSLSHERELLKQLTTITITPDSVTFERQPKPAS